MANDDIVKRVYGNRCMELLRSLFKKGVVVKDDAAQFLRFNRDIAFLLLVLVSMFGAVLCKYL
jgi:tetraacyldisaccharide-1-P 4'-kinase